MDAAFGSRHMLILVSRPVGYQPPAAGASKSETTFKSSSGD